MEEKKTMCAHRLSLDNRQEGTVTGVRDIHSFNESEILLETEAGRLSVKGRTAPCAETESGKGRGRY